MEFIAAYLCLLVIVAVNAFALHCTWGWFVVPLGAPALTYGAWVGLFLFASVCLQVVKPASMDEKPDQNDERLERLIKLALFNTCVMALYLSLGLLVECVR